MDLSSGIWMSISLLVFLVLNRNYVIYQKLASAKAVSFKFSFAPLLLLLVTPIIILSLPALAIYRKTVNLILAWRFGSKYCGLLDGRDSVFNLENRNPIQILFVVKYHSRSSQDFHDAVRDAVFEVLKSSANPKIFGAVRTFLGYSYLLRDEITFNECFQKLKHSNLLKSKNDLVQLIGEYSNIPLPKNREGLWDVFVGTQPVEWMEDAENDEIKHYPILFRMSHSFADAKHFLKGIIRLFADSDCVAHTYESEEFVLLDQQLSSVTLIPKVFVNFRRRLIFFVRQFYLLFIATSVSLVNSILAVNDSHILHGPRLTHRKHLFVNVETSTHYVQVVKRIKKKIPGCTFEDICLTAIAASFKEYFQRNSTTMPEYVTAEVPAKPRSVRANKPNVETIHCRNRFTYAIRRLPTHFDSENTNTPLINTLEIIKNEGNTVRRSLEHEINYFVLRVICHLIPAPALRALLNTLHNFTATISNVIGPSRITVMGGCHVQDIIPWINTRGHSTGVAFGLFTYDERLQITLAVDETLVTNRHELQSLLDGVHKYLDLLEHETTNIFDEKAS